jgi:predicted acylesterase/phospholipase RssA
VVFSGGASQSMAFVGCIRYLEHSCLISHVRKVVGSSAGAIVALLFALGMSSDDMIEKLVTSIERNHANQISLEDAIEIGDTYGIDSGRNMVRALEEVIDEYMSSKDATFADIARVRGIDVTICVMNLTKKKYEYMSVDNTPDMPVKLAIRMSISLPLLFAPVRYGKFDDLYVDPFIGRNFPHDYPGSNPADNAVLGLRIDLTSCSYTDSFASYALSMVNFMIEQSNVYDMSHYKWTIIDISPGSAPSFSTETLQFEYNKEIATVLSKIGYTTLKSVLDAKLIYFSRQDETAYEEPRRSTDEGHVGIRG